MCNLFARDIFGYRCGNISPRYAASNEVIQDFIARVMSLLKLSPEKKREMMNELIFSCGEKDWIRIKIRNETWRM